MAAPEPPLAGLRIVERGVGLAAGYAGFLLSGLGAEVVRVEPPGGSVTPGDRVLRRNQRSVAWKDPDGSLWAALSAGADAVLTDETAPEPPPTPGALRCRVTTWGRDGHPHRLPPEEALVAAATGLQAMQWSWGGGPVWLVTPMVAYMTGMLAALGIVSAAFARRRGAPGQAIEVSGLGGAFALQSGTYVRGPGQKGSLSQYGDPRGVYPNYSLYRASDGWLFVGALTQAFWVKLLTVLERVDLLADERLQGNPLTFGAPAVKEFVRTQLDPIFATRTAAAWVAALREADIPCGAVQSREEALRDADARALGLVAALPDPSGGSGWQPAEPAAFSDTPAPPPRPASTPGADTEAVRNEMRRWRRTRQPVGASPPRTCLAGIRVLDLASFIAGPFCPMLLADLGAEVLKVESADGDPFRMAAFAFLGWNRGKRSIVLDLKRPEGRAVFLDLVRAADVVVDNFRAGVMERLGIGWETLAAANPRLVHTSITGFGSAGPLAALPGFDPVFQARSGLMQAQGGADDPVFHMVAYNDYAAGTLGALATVAALLARERTGRGQRVDVSLFRTSLVAQAAHLHPSAETGGCDYRGPSACRRLYACRDGWICIAASAPAQAAALGRSTNTAVTLDDPADGPAAAAIAAVLADESRTAALDRLAAAGVPAAPCVTFDEVFIDPFLAARGCLVEQEHPVLGAVLLGGPLIGFEATPIVYRRSAPVLGADGPAALRELGFSEERIEALLAAGVVGRPG
jgi:crotonobetainyl-CoA:carnitine CoA-transferase CaiB-like acyl-CoA transferase